MRTIASVIALQGILALSAWAGVTAPCFAGAAGENIIPVKNSQITYCISDFGWSDTYLLGTPAAYNLNMDLFSGDDAFNLNYNAPAAGLGPGTGWLSPSLDEGTLSPQNVASRYTVISPVHSTGATTAESVIQNPDGIRITIDTEAIGLGVRISLYITNTSISPITGLQLADYFNYHPNGSIDPNQLMGTTSYQNGCIVTTGVPGPGFLMNGFMCGLTTPDNHSVGFASGSTPVWQAVQNDQYFNNSGPVGPGDTAGALEWNLGTLAPGATVAFQVGKNATTITPPVLPFGADVPEPGTELLTLTGSALMLLGLAGRALGRKQKNSSN